MKDRIERVLRYYSISPSQFADEIGVQRSSISHIISERNKPSLDLVQKMLGRFKELNPDWLIHGKGEMLRNSNTQSLFSSLPETNLKLETNPVPSVEPAKNDGQSSVIDKTKLTSNTHTTIYDSSEDQHNTTSQQNSLIENVKKNDEIEKIVIFYKDKTFSIHIPR